MPKTEFESHVAFLAGQVHALRALSRALIQIQDDREALLRELKISTRIGRDQIRSLPTPNGALRAYQQACDELIVAVARQTYANKERIVPF